MWWRRWGRGVEGATLARATGGGVGLSIAELTSCGVIGTRRLFGRVKSVEPDSGLLPQVANFNCIATPWMLPHAFVLDLLGVRI